MTELTHRHLLKYLNLRRSKKIGPIWIDGPTCFIGKLNSPYGETCYISHDDLIALIEHLAGERIGPGSVKGEKLYEQYCA